ncbi:hypothetical protein GJ496_006621 [Pomphorhynchus laevis]|nr:hypothetical protein GJ496_006621 [Pomphorhynchus laevis]
MQSISLSQIKRIQITVVSIIKNQVKCIFEIPGVFIEFLFDQARFNPEIVGSVISSMIVKRSTKEEIYQQSSLQITVVLNEAEGETTLTADKLANSIKRHSADYKQSFIVKIAHSHFGVTIHCNDTMRVR